MYLQILEMFLQKLLIDVTSNLHGKTAAKKFHIMFQPRPKWFKVLSHAVMIVT